MKFDTPLIPARLIRRYKRFLADMETPDGKLITAHCPNSGSMKGCLPPGAPVLLSRSDNPTRKYPYTWEMVRVKGIWVGINTGLPNRIVAEAIADGKIKELSGYPKIKREVKYGENSRVDILLENGVEKCYVEVKNVTLEEEGTALFPDSVTVRGQKHLRELMSMVEAGHRAVIFFLVQRGDCRCMAPADDIDPDYGRLLRQAVIKGVEALAYRADVRPTAVSIGRKLPVRLDAGYAFNR